MSDLVNDAIKEAMEELDLEDQLRQEKKIDSKQQEQDLEFRNIDKLLRRSIVGCFSVALITVLSVVGLIAGTTIAVAKGLQWIGVL